MKGKLEASQALEGQSRPDESTQKQTEEALTRSESRYRSIFEFVPVSIWEEDWSEVMAMVDELRHQGVTDFRRYFDAHPEFVTRALQRIGILDINAATLDIFKARNKAELTTSLQAVFSTPDSLEGF